MIKRIVLPSTGLSHAIAMLAIGMSCNGVYSPMKGETETLSSENHKGTVLDPATQVSAWESSSVRLSSDKGLWNVERSITRDRQPRFALPVGEFTGSVPPVLPLVEPETIELFAPPSWVRLETWLFLSPSCLAFLAFRRFRIFWRCSSDNLSHSSRVYDLVTSPRGVPPPLPPLPPFLLLLLPRSLPDNPDTFLSCLSWVALL
mmetsp:Transcript_8654/g.12615  ORF Transcript_8654/g.12615 Transcript_8654/m.12615 type:complete len:203 (+) Transcript_8654:453-1061(+)